MSLEKAFHDLAPLGSEATLPAGTCLWREGDAGDEVALLHEGTREVVHDGPDGEAVVLRKLEGGAVLGEIACLDGESRSASVRAVTACRVSRIPGEAFRDFLKGRPDIIQDLFWQQLQRVRTLTREVARTYRRAITDPLTGLYNIGFFRERLELEVRRAREAGDPLAVVMFDIDHFKRFNDTYGHENGNVVLKGTSRIFRSHARRGDILARYGGEEFVALLYGAVRDEAWKFAEEMRKAVAAEEFPIGQYQPGRITLSAGVACFPQEGVGREVHVAAAALVAAADVNLYKAKSEGRNRIVSGVPAT